MITLPKAVEDSEIALPAAEAERRLGDRQHRLTPVFTAPKVPIREQWLRAASRMRGPAKVTVEQTAATREYLSGLDLTATLPIGDPRRGKAVRDAIADYLAQRQRELPSAWQVVERLYQETEGLGPLDNLMANENVTDVDIYDWNHVTYSETGRPKHLPARPFLSYDHYRAVIYKLMALGGVTLKEEEPHIKFTVPGGHRVHVRGPWVTRDEHIKVNIRRQRSQVLTMKDLIEQRTISEPAARWLYSAADRDASGFVAGPPGAGKTTVLQALLLSLCRKRRIVSIEEAPELQPPRTTDSLWEPWVTQKRNLEGEKVFDLGAQIEQSLWANPQIVAVGEITNTGAAAMLFAMSLGRAGWFTIHGHDSSEALKRFETWAHQGSQHRDLAATRSFISDTSLSVAVVMEEWLHPRSKVIAVDEIVGLDNDGNLVTSNIWEIDEDGLLRLNSKYRLSDRLRRRGVPDPAELEDRYRLSGRRGERKEAA